MEVLKVDRRLGIIFGFGMVCKEVKDGIAKEYFDLHGDNISETEMLKAAADFMTSERVGKVQHDGKQVGDILFAFPLTEDIAKALEITAPKYGLLIGYKPSDPAVMEAAEKGEFGGFSFGGLAIREAA